jgi:hypothetical protein
MKFKKGDKVKVKDTLVVDEKYGGWKFSSSMNDMSGKVVTIAYGVASSYYKIEEDSNLWEYTDAMFEDETAQMMKKMSSLEERLTEIELMLKPKMIGGAKRTVIDLSELRIQKEEVVRTTIIKIIGEDNLLAIEHEGIVFIKS